MEITQAYAPEDQARIDKARKVIEHHSELLIREILACGSIRERNQDCDRIYQADPVRTLLIKRLADIHTSIIPQISFASTC